MEARGKVRTEAIGAKLTIREKASSGAMNGSRSREAMWTAPATIRIAAAENTIAKLPFLMGRYRIGARSRA